MFFLVTCATPTLAMMVRHDRMQYRVKEIKNMYLVYQKSQAHTQGVRISGILRGCDCLENPDVGSKMRGLNSSFMVKNCMTLK